MMRITNGFRPCCDRWHRRASPFADRVPKAGALFVKPTLVAQIEYRRKGPEGILQQAAFKGLRTDKSAETFRLLKESAPWHHDHSGPVRSRLGW